MDRFWNKVDIQGPLDCWLWLDPLQRGYGRFSDSGRTHRAHRYAYELLVGPIPVGLTVDHLCRVRHCVNPLHFELVTLGENARRANPGERRAKQQLAKTHCPQGHPYDEENTYRYERRRGCRACHLVRSRAHKERIREART